MSTSSLTTEKHKRLVEIARSGAWDNMSQLDLTFEYKISSHTVKKIQDEAGVTPIGSIRLYPFDLMNWELPNTDLEEIWVMRFNRAGIERNRHKKRSPRWKKNGGITPKDPEYHRALEVERSKAQEYKKSKSENTL